MLKLVTDGQVMMAALTEGASLERARPWRSKAAAATVVGSAGALGAVSTLAVLGDTGLHAAVVKVTTGSAGAVLTVMAGHLLLRRMRRTEALTDVALTATVTLLAAVNVLLAVIPSLVGPTKAQAVHTIISAGAGVVIAGGFALASVAHGTRASDAKASADRYLLYGLCLALALIAATAGIVGASDGSAASGESAGIVVAHVVAAVLAGVAAVAFVRRASIEPDPVLIWLAVATAVTAVASLSDAAMPWTPAEVPGGQIVQVAGWFALVVAGLRDFEWAQLRRTEDAVVDERRRVARELHDGLAQELAYIASKATDRDLAEAAHRALEESRTAIMLLTRPSDEPLERMIADAARSAAERAAIDVTVAVRPGLDAAPNVRQALLRILREAMTNAVRHGAATHIRISVDGPAPLVMAVADDGKGFEVDRQRRPDSLGLQSMRERAENLGGRITIESSRDTGTTVAVVIP